MGTITSRKEAEKHAPDYAAAKATPAEPNAIAAKTFALLVLVNTAERNPVILEKIQLTLLEYKKQITKSAHTPISLDLAEIKEQLNQIQNRPLKALSEHLEIKPDDEFNHDSGVTVKEQNLIADLKIAEEAPLKALQAIQHEYAERQNDKLSANNIFKLPKSRKIQRDPTLSAPAPIAQNNNVVVQLNPTVLSHIIEQELDKIATKLQEKASLTLRQGLTKIQATTGSKVPFFHDHLPDTTPITTPVPGNKG